MSAMSYLLLLGLSKGFVEATSCKITINYKNVSVLDSDWKPFTPKDVKIANLLNSAAGCKRACSLFGDECSGFKMISDGTCTLGKVHASTQYVSEFEQDLTELTIKVEKVEVMDVPHFFSFEEFATSVVLPEYDSVAKVEIGSVPGFNHHYSEPSFVEPYGEGLIKCGGVTQPRGNVSSHDCWTYSFITREWTSSTPMLRGHAYGPGLSFQNKYWVFGGIDNDDASEYILHVPPHKHVETPKSYLLAVSQHFPTRSLIDYSIEFDTATGVFGNRRTIPWSEPTVQPACHVYRPVNAVVCVGGQSLTHGFVDGFCKYDLHSRTWSCPDEMKLPNGGYMGGLHLIGGKLILAGHWRFNSKGDQERNAVFEYHQDGRPEYWTEIKVVKKRVGRYCQVLKNIQYYRIVG